MSTSLPLFEPAAPARALLSQPLTTATRAFHVMTKPIGPICNLDCKYCFYLEKENLYQGTRKWAMRDEVLEEYIRQYIASQPVPEVSFAWQGGEPTLLGVDFFRRVVELQSRHAGGKTIINAIQTNGTLLDDEWCDLLASHKFLVGLSIDGPNDLHDAYRVDKQGKPTSAGVREGLKLLKKHGVDFNTLTVLSRVNSREPLKVYRFLREIGSGYIQFIPLVERRPSQRDREMGLDHAPPPTHPHPTHPDPDEGSQEAITGEQLVTDESLLPADFGEFYVQVFEEWVRRDVGRTFVQLFDIALGQWAGAPPGLCFFSPTCGSAMAIEHSGDVYSCDHYVYPQFKLGNVMDQSLAAMLDSPFQRKFGRDKLDLLPRYCRECEVRFACHGECPKHRFTRTPDGEPGLNYLCAGYKRFFNHIDPHMRTMVKLLRAQRPPAEIMQLIKRYPDGAWKQLPGF
jgi:uncharacterized protein